MHHKRILVFLLFLLVFCGCSAKAPVVTDEPPPPPPKATKLIPIEPLCQFPDYPTGCEVTATVTALRHYGESITVGDFIDGYLRTDDRFYRKGFTLYGPDPRRVFVGDPRTKASYGCFAPVILDSLSRYYNSSHRVIDATGTPLEALCRQHIDQGRPVILWASIRMVPISEGQSWRLESGERFVWPSGEHCLLLVGYSDSAYFFCDPQYTDIIAYDKELCEARYEEMGQQALVILPP